MPKPSEQAAPPVPLSTALTKPIKKSQLQRLKDRKYLEHVEPLLDGFYKVLIDKVRRGDIKAIQIVAQMEQMVKGNGVTVNNNINQNNLNHASQEREQTRSFASLVRKLDSRDGKEQEIMDAEIVTPDD